MLRRGGHLHTIAPLLRMSVLAMLLLSWAGQHALGQGRHFEFEIVDGVIADTPPTLKVTQGDRVVIELVSNEDTLVHLHAYDLKLQLEAGVPAELAFEAHHSGRFPAALHWPADGGHREDRALLYLEVYPQ